MLTIRQEQIAIFDEDRRVRFEADLAAHLLKVWPRECRLAGGPGRMPGIVRKSIEGAHRHGYRSERELTLFALMIFSLGMHFDRDPQCGWATRSLDNLAFDNPTQRIEAAYEEMVDYLGRIGGRNSEWTVRALVRMRGHDFHTALPENREERAETLTEVLETLWPEKVAFQEVAPTLAMVRAALAQAEKRGLQGDHGDAAYAVLSFFLGFDFVDDPLHPWASIALMAAPAGPKRSDALLQAALRRMQDSLKPE